MNEQTKSETCNAEGVKCGVEREPRKVLRVIGQNDGPRRENQNLYFVEKVSVYAMRGRRLTSADV